jgi:Putative adhesin
MQEWTIDEPGQLTFGDVDTLDVRIVAGHLDVLASDGPPTLEITEIESASPLLVSYDETTRTLTVAYRDLTWDGLLGWLRRDRRRTVLSVAVPKTCRVKAGVVSASAVVAGFERTTDVRGVSGEIVLDGVSGNVAAQTVSGDVESRAMDGDLSFISVSGDLTVADGTPRRLKANTVSGRITADLALRPTGYVTLHSVSGDILVRLPENVEADVSCRSTSGRLVSAFEELSNTSSPGSKTLSGRLGGGMASLSAITVSGEVTLLKGEKE